MQVLQAPFAQVVIAETLLKRQHQHQIAGRKRPGMIGSFGQATEVTRRKAPISLAEMLPGGAGVTDRFRQPSSPSGIR